MFRSRDGVTRYVEHYDHPARACPETVANRIYRELRFEAPNSALVRRSNGKLSFAAGSTFLVTRIESRRGGGANISMREIDPSARNRIETGWTPSPADQAFNARAEKTFLEMDEAEKRGDLVPASLRKKAGDQVKPHAVLADSNHPAAKVNAEIEAMSYDELDDEFGGQLDEPSGRNRHCVPDGTREELPNQVSNGRTPRRSRSASRKIKKTDRKTLSH